MNISCDDLGSGDPALLFIHGWCCDRSYFAPQFEHFAPTHRVIAVDQRGHGKSQPASDGDYSVPAFAADSAELIAELGLDRPVLIGHSLGGCVSLAVAASRPELVRGVVMVDPAPIIMNDDFRAMMTSIAPAMNTVEGRKGFVATMFAPTDDAARKEQIIAAMSGASDDVAVAAIEGLTAWDGAAALAACKAPIVSIGSASPTNDAAALKEHCPQIIVGQTVGAGHFNQLEVPDQVNAMIEQFLRVAI